ncbi:putative protein of unknown function (DUF1846) [Blattamonas nauphoetae]|uniref:DUF1846 domain-containing protein n=1 Tax=Blattamonas nauphoetae TaxID=2049346 RepID=A0ABQ9Y6S0_9EUKA|nr:putative protein of unknown function (DUF1846) [Blattamonas nauphoetae]
MTGFDNDKYLKHQSKMIRERIERFGGKLYLEFGGKLFDDYHASRVLPGFQPDSKVRMLAQLSDIAEIVICINAQDIDKCKIRNDIGITYDTEVLRLIDSFQDMDLTVGSIVVTQFTHQQASKAFVRQLRSLNFSVYCHYPIEEYPQNLSLIASDDGFGKNEFVETTRPLVVVTAPGPGSGKLAVCLSQLYQEAKRGTVAGYAKFETFPIWNLPLKHPVTLAYEAATADLNDVTMIDSYHLDAYNVVAVNYNRDIEAFPLLRAMLEKINGSCPYLSPTDMGVNAAGLCIVNDDVVCHAARQEIIRRFYTTQCALKQGTGSAHAVTKLKILLQQAKVTPNDRSVVGPALDAAKTSSTATVAIELPSKRIVIGKSKDLLGSVAAALINSLKVLANIDDSIDVIAESSLAPIQLLRTEHLHCARGGLHCEETLIALVSSSTFNPTAAKALSMLALLRGCQAHSSVMLAADDVLTCTRLGLQLTCEPVFPKGRLYGR